MAKSDTMHSELVVAIILSASTLFSLSLLWFTRSKDGQLKLPKHSDGQDTDSHDPFNVLRPMDLSNGEPIDEQDFWHRMTIRKLGLSVLLSLVTIIETISLGWSATSDDSQEELATYTLRTLFASYTLSLSIRSFTQNQIKHFSTICHISALTFLAALSVSLITVISSAEGHAGSGAISSWVVLALEFCAFVVASTIPRGPLRHYPPSLIYTEKTLQASTIQSHDNVCGSITASVFSTLIFSYTTRVMKLGQSTTSFEVADLPIVPASIRAALLFTNMKRTLALPTPFFKTQKGSGWGLFWRLVRLNWKVFAMEMCLSTAAAVLYYVPALFLQKVVAYLESDPERSNKAWGVILALGLFVFNALGFLVTGQLWSLVSLVCRVRLRTQLNSVLFAKTLVRKDVASNANSHSPYPIHKPNNASPVDSEHSDLTAAADEDSSDEGDFSSKAQIMTLMTTDVDRVSEFSVHAYALVDAPIEIIIGTIFLYKLLGVSCFFGLAVSCIGLPLNHFVGKVVVGAQDNLMKARDERVALMNEILGGIRMIKFMAWERSFEAKVLKVREKELKYQRLNFIIETLWNGIWNATPVLVTLVSFWHFAVVRGQTLTPSIAFTTITVFSEMKYALNTLPETLINTLQCLVSLRRIEKYLQGAEVTSVPPISNQSQSIAMQSATVTWPQDRSLGSRASSATSTPGHKFVLVDLTLRFPEGKLSLICGRLGSGKTLLLLALLGEADLLAGQILCPRSPPDALAVLSREVPPEEWVVNGLCAYVPQVTWLRNASIKDNILFNLPYNATRYHKTLEACALLSDLEILEDGDESEIGERGVNLSGGQKARVSLARAVYSRASLLLLDDVLSAVDAHTAHHLYHQCLKGELMEGRTVILASHHVALCAPGSSYVIALDNGRIQFEGESEAFLSSSIISGLMQSGQHGNESKQDDTTQVMQDSDETIEQIADSSSVHTDPESDTSSTAIGAEGGSKKAKTSPRRLVEDEKRAVGRVSRNVWQTYISAFGSKWSWTIMLLILLLATVNPVGENWWLQYWSGSPEATNSPVYYIGIYAGITVAGLVMMTARWFFLYNGSIRASIILYQKLLESVLFANTRFHDTVSRGRLLNRFGKDFEGIDSNLADNFGRSLINMLSVTTTLITISVVGGVPFIFAMICLGLVYYHIAQNYGQTSRDMRRLDSVTRSPLYSIYGETIAGVTILRAFGASSKFLRDMLCCVDTNTNPYYWMWGVNRWLSVRFNLLSSAVIGLTALVSVLSPQMTASLAGLTLAFAATFTNDILMVARRFVTLEQSMVALERVKEYTDLDREAIEFMQPRPAASWPSEGAIYCQNLVIRYAPDLPDVLHNINFEVKAGEKIGILGRTGSGKSTLALSLFRFVEATNGRIFVDGVDIATVGLTDLRSRLTIIPQDPTIMSGTLRTTLDIFNEHEDAEIYEALRRVHLIPSGDLIPDQLDTIENINVFRNLDSPVSEGGDNFSTGEKQLLCMARAILKRSKILVMDEATASVDYATDELISKTIRHEFASSTILTIAHRLRTVIDYDKVMVLDQGRLVEFDRPATLLKNTSSSFYKLCRATGKRELEMLEKMAGVNLRS